MSTSTKIIIGSLAITSFAGLGFALPAQSTAAPTNGSSSHGQLIQLSEHTPEIFGQNAADYDYYLGHNSSAYHPRAKEAVAIFGQAVKKGDQQEVMTAFLNATQAGTLSHEQASNTTWKCLELGESMAAHVDDCKSVHHPGNEIVDDHADVEKRSFWRWFQSANHVASRNAMTVLLSVLGSRIDRSLPDSPRSVCEALNGIQACISWSAVESFSTDYAANFVQDALDTVDFNQYSAQANGVLGSKKRNAADVCLSNRPNGCT
jgi:hypothetical protein